MRLKYSTTKLCTCGCGKPARAFGKYHDDTHGLRVWRRTRAAAKAESKPQVQVQPQVQVEQLPMFTPAVKKQCSCGDFQRCLICRNAEKRRAWKAGEVPVYRMSVIETITAAAMGD